MKRNEFLQTCAGACGCGMLGLLAPLPASAGNSGDQTTAAPDETSELKRRLDGAQERFAKLLTIMGDDLKGFLAKIRRPGPGPLQYPNALALSASVATARYPPLGSSQAPTR